MRAWCVISLWPGGGLEHGGVVCDIIVAGGRKQGGGVLALMLARRGEKRGGRVSLRCVGVVVKLCVLLRVFTVVLGK